MSNFHQQYRDALKHPLWQRNRLLVFERDKFTCQKCSSTETELQVHHLNYRYGLLPYQYNISELQTLCIDCHFNETLLQIFNRHQIEGNVISKLAFAFGNCKGEDEKLLAIIDLIYLLSTLTHPQLETFVSMAEIESQKFL